MATPRYIPDGWITSEPSSDTSKLRPTVEGTWTAPTKENPEILVKLVEDGEEPIPVNTIRVKGNMPKVLLSYKAKNDENLPFTPYKEPGDEEPKVKS